MKRSSRVVDLAAPGGSSAQPLDHVICGWRAIPDNGSATVEVGKGAKGAITEQHLGGIQRAWEEDRVEDAIYIGRHEFDRPRPNEVLHLDLAADVEDGLRVREGVGPYCRRKDGANADGAIVDNRHFLGLGGCRSRAKPNRTLIRISGSKNDVCATACVRPQDHRACSCEVGVAGITVSNTKLAGDQEAAGRGGSDVKGGVDSP